MTVGQLCNRAVVVCGADEDVLQAARRMRDHHVGSLVVVEGSAEQTKPIGMVTDRDIVLSAVAADGRLPGKPVRYIMSGDIVSAREREDLTQVLQRMRARGIRRIPVVNDDGILQGILAFDDIFEFLAEEMDELVRLLGRERLQEKAP